jgi:hypothetical protein
MKLVGGSMLVAALACVAAAILWWRASAVPGPTAKPAASIARLPTNKIGDAVSAPQNSISAPHPEAHSRNPGIDYAARLRTAPDYLEYVRSLVGAARVGDHAAQFYIFRAFDKCNHEYHLYFGSRSIQVSLDDALRWAANKGWPFDPEEVRQVHKRCFGLLDTGVKELGDRHEWLRLASEGGYPLAQVLFAVHQASEARKAGTDDAAGREARRLKLAEALRSRDPEVIFEIGTALYITEAIKDETEGEESEREESRWDETEWVLAACFRGLACSPRSEIARRLCLFDRACQPFESVVDILRRGYPAEFPVMEEHAREINEKLDAGDWAGLGF